ncbi:MAG: hypothetical protein AB1817_08755 [Chloroflexota bacterium]
MDYYARLQIHLRVFGTEFPVANPNFGTIGKMPSKCRIVWEHRAEHLCGRGNYDDALA